MRINIKTEVTLQHLLQLHEERAKCYIHAALHTHPDDSNLSEIFSEHSRQSQQQAKELSQQRHEEEYIPLSDSNDPFNLKKIRQEMEQTFRSGNRLKQQTINTCLVMEEALQNAYATALINEAGKRYAPGFGEVLRAQQTSLRNSYNRIVSLQKNARVF